MATQNEAAAHIDLGDRRFRELIDDGVIERRRPSEYDLEQVRVSYIRHLRKVAAGRGTKTDADLSTERALLTREQRDAAALKNAISRGEFVSIEEACRQVETEYGVVRQRLLAIPGKLADALEGMNREEREVAMAGEITEALDELHDPVDAAIDGAARPDGNGVSVAPGAESAEAATAAEPDRVG
jgi:phage terminase Nu1 subunit (DNA packaging protein)